MSPLLLGLYLGVIASVTLVGVFVYAIQRDRAYLWYVVFQVGTASHVLVSDATGVGVLERVGVGFADVHQFLRPFSAGMMLLGTVMFAATFLHTGRRVPLGHWFLTGLACYAVGLMALSLVGLGNTAGRPLRYLGVVAPVAILLVGVDDRRAAFVPSSAAPRRTADRRVRRAAGRGRASTHPQRL